MNSQMGAVYKLINYNASWKQYVKMSDIVAPTPTDAFIFADEHAGSINDGYLQVGLESPVFPDVPGSYHGGVGAFSFADGHTALRKWITGVIVIPVAAGVNIASIQATPNNADWLWVRDHSSTKTSP